MRALPRVLTPAGRGLLIAAIAVAAVVVGHGLGFRWDPFGLTARRLEAAETRAAVATREADARRLETEGLADQARRLDQHHQQAVAVGRATALASAQARSAHDASLPLDPARAGRLVRHDRELCRLAPAVCRPAEADASASRGETVHSGPPA